MSRIPEYDGKRIHTALFDNVEFLERSENITSSISPEDIIKNAIDQYLREFGDYIFSKSDIGLIVNDRNRPTPTSIVLEDMLRRFPDLGTRISKVHIATGTHNEPSENDIREILGKTFSRLEGRVHIHKAKNEQDHSTIGKTSRGTEVKFDSTIFDHDILLLINSVEPHYFAGFTGGRKSLLPGMAAYSTIEKNHSHALDPGSRTLALKGNPVHEDMEEAVKMFLRDREHISFQLVQGPGKILSDVVIGDIFDAFSDAVTIAEKQFCIEVSKKFDIVISFAGYPMDRTLYQAQKAIENGKLALKEGGILILVAKCGEGIGNSTFWDLLSSSEKEEDVILSIDREYKLGYHKAAKIAELSSHSSIYMVSGIDPDILKEGFIHGFATVEEAVEEAISNSDDDPDILLIPDGTVTVPKLPERY